MKYISSKNNPIYKKTYKLSNNSRFRKKNNLFIVEGLEKIELAIENNFKAISLGEKRLRAETAGMYVCMVNSLYK